MLNSENDLKNATKTLRTFLTSSKGKQLSRKLRKASQIYVVAALHNETRGLVIAYGIDGNGLFTANWPTETGSTTPEEARAYLRTLAKEEIETTTITEVINGLSKGPVPVSEVIETVIAHLTMSMRVNVTEFGSLPN